MSEQKNFSDLQIISTAGLTKEDLTEAEKLSCVS